MIDLNIRHTLGNNWILREDPHHPNKRYSIYNIHTQMNYIIKKPTYTLLNIFRLHALSVNELMTHFVLKDINFDWEGFWNVCNKIVPFDLLVESNEPFNTEDFHYKKCDMSGYDIPVASAPYGVELHFTHKCNLKCRHCFQNSSPYSHKFKELEAEQWVSIIKQFVRNKVHDVTISGGEPLCYSQFSTLFNEIVNEKIHYTILTNATLVNDYNIDALSKNNVTLSISLDGHSEKLHDDLRGKGVYQQVIKSIKRLINHKARISLSYTINAHNYLYMKEFVNFADSMGVRSVAFGFIENNGRAKQNANLILSLSQRQLAKSYFEQIKDKYNGKVNLNLIEVASLNNNFSNSNKVYCSAGTTRIGVSADGKLYPCVYGFGNEELIMGDLTKEYLEDIWENKEKWKMFRGSIQLEKINQCATCTLNNKCTLRNCRLRNYANYSLYNKPQECAIDYSIHL
ncbi:radical SAM protein [Phocaeicola sp.]|uniref:radical SAM/SPASM domain-containing protein n=1 Tax=Phocaeicola sp. TaxID=2773926 RepID=UPI0023D02657|nr:radical SAM protein [Phocaeicola sp.]MDE5676249.1 radical SAM protein [Phocaeicola sp.]